MQTGMPRESMPPPGRVALMPEARGDPTTDHYVFGETSRGEGQGPAPRPL